MLLGWLGLAQYVTDGDVTTIVDNVLQIAGMIMAIYGRYMSKGEAVTILGVKR